jgi:alkaline phosphatase D
MQPISRRTFFALGATVVIAACSGDDSGTAEPATTPAPDTTTTPDTTAAPDTTTPATEAPTTTVTDIELPGDPFTLGVTSGDPDATSVVLWTRLRAKEGAMPDADIDVTWELAADPSFAQVTATGTATAEARYGHSVHQVVEVDGTAYYRFRVGDYTSPVGRCLPASETDTLKMASASCQHYETGYYAAYRDMAEWQPDLIVHLGDFIYEGSGTPEVGEGRVRTHLTPEPTTVEEYRTRYELYLSDQDLLAARAVAPWAVIWDDHEVENNYAALIPQDEADLAGFPARRDAAYQVWWEHMPVRLPAPTAGQDFPIYRAITWGSLADVLLLDGRQYRDDQACGDATLSFDPPCDEVFDPTRAMLGAEQEAWMAEQLRSASGAWTVIAQQTVMSRLVLNGAILNYDQWDGYPAARERFYGAVRDAARDSVVVITGDIHLAGVGRLVDDDGRALGTEWVTTSISSRATVPEGTEDLVNGFPDVVDVELSHRGYTRHVVTPAEWVAEYRIVEDVLSPDSPVSTWKSFRVAAGSTEVSAVEA